MKTNALLIKMMFVLAFPVGMPAAEMDARGAVSFAFGEDVTVMRLAFIETSSGAWKSAPADFSGDGQSVQIGVNFPQGRVNFRRGLESDGSGFTVHDTWEGGAEAAFVLNTIEIAPEQLGSYAVSNSDVTMRTLDAPPKKISVEEGITLHHIPTGADLSLTFSTASRVEYRVNESGGVTIRMSYPGSGAIPSSGEWIMRAKIEGSE